MTFEANRYSLVADIGGTNTRVALCDGPKLLGHTVQRFRNADYPDLETVLRSYRSGLGNVDCLAACVAVAGPVRDGTGTLTNLNWTISERTLAGATDATTASILNDLQAQGHAIGLLDPANVRCLVDRPVANPEADKLVIGVGTGFNAAAVFETPGGRVVAASESGHTTIPVRSDADYRLCRFIETAHGFPAVEEVLSGRGIELVYAWLSQEAGQGDRLTAAEIMAAVAAGGDARAWEAAQVFVRILGAATGDLALTFLPFGGIYLVGGVARAFGPYLGDLDFAEAIRDKGRFSAFTGDFRVSLIEDDYAALTGCAAHLGHLLKM